MNSYFKYQDNNVATSTYELICEVFRTFQHWPKGFRVVLFCTHKEGDRNEILKKNSWIIEDQSLINTKNHASPLKTKLHIKFGFNSKKLFPLSAKFWQIFWTIFLSLFNTWIFMAVSTLHTYVKEVREKIILDIGFDEVLTNCK